MIDDRFFILFGIALQLIVGLVLIEAYFARKERFVDRLQNKLKGKA